MNALTEESHHIRASKTSSETCLGFDISQARPFALLKKTSGKSAVSSQVEEKDDVHLRDGRHPVLCRRCGQEITLAEYAVTISGRHEHTFNNPAGVTFQIGCFSLAGGCAVYGPPAFEFTWFSGFAWSVCLCTNCTLHMGWFYQSAEASFFGLITTNLVRTIRPH